MIHVDLVLPANILYTYICFQHPCIQVIFLDLVTPPELNIPTGYPRIRHIRDKHLQWLKVNKGAWHNLEVTTCSSISYILK